MIAFLFSAFIIVAPLIIGTRLIYKDKSCRTDIDTTLLLTD